MQTIPTPRPVAPPSAKKEPEDIFSGIEQPKSGSMKPGIATMPRSGGGSIVKTLVWIAVIVLVLVIVGFLFWYFAIHRSADSSQKISPAATVAEPPAPPAPPPEVPATPEPVTEPEATSTLPPPITVPPAGSNVPPPTAVESTSTSTVAPPLAVKDTDGDGLSDEREVELGTDPNKADTDSDGLSDGEEVLQYGTNPLNADTDGDGYQDGVEMKNGFNPRGPGKCVKEGCVL
ncbi:MAG: hypothetical protein Q8R07_01355 [Candidatus Uhrbacteria bacterium]|nr:hypothetical protein [Candidatus Uhrbacteria bacterium]